MTSKDLIVYRQYEISGFKATLEINHLKKTVSFVQYDSVEEKFVPKHWLFAERDLKYMNGWLLILYGMAEVVKQAKLELEKRQDEDVEEMMRVFIALDDIKEKNK